MNADGTRTRRPAIRSCAYCGKVKALPDGFPSTSYARCWECAWAEHQAREHQPKRQSRWRRLDPITVVGWLVLTAAAFYGVRVGWPAGAMMPAMGSGAVLALVCLQLAAEEPSHSDSDDPSGSDEQERPKQ